MRDITNTDLAHKAGINPATVSGLLNGKAQGRVMTITAIAKALGMKESEFIALGE